jgi:hypothetical protein
VAVETQSGDNLIEVKGDDDIDQFVNQGKQIVEQIVD